MALRDGGGSMMRNMYGEHRIFSILSLDEAVYLLLRYRIK